MGKVTNLSISIVSYNNERDIIDLINQIEKYTSKSISKTIYIIDNANGRVNFKSIVDLYDDVIYVASESNIGFGSAHNLVLNMLNSQYHCILNPDICLENDVFSKIIEYMNSIDNNIMIIPKLLDENKKLQRAYRSEITVFDLLVRVLFYKLHFFKKRYDKHTLQNYNFEKTQKIDFAQGSFLILKTKTFKIMKGFDDRFFMYMEDADFCRRFNEIGDIIYFPYSYAIHRWEKGSHRSIKLLKYHTYSIYLYFKKWGIKWF